MATVDRITVTVPKELSARLKVVRDRMNVSRVCADALEKELNIIEAKPSVADPKIAQLVERLKGARQRWYDHGREDGATWAAQEANRSELEDAAYGFASYDGRQLRSAYFDLPEHDESEEGQDGEDGKGVPQLPGVGNLSPRVERWVLRDLGLEKEPTVYGSKEYTEFRAALGKVDYAAYLEGWRDAVVRIWDAVLPALR